MTSDQDRVLVLAPTASDATLSQSLFEEAGMRACICRDIHVLQKELDAGAGILLLTEVALISKEAHLLSQTLQRQPSWSDIPILLLAASGSDSTVAAQAMDLFSNVTVLERPARLTTLVSALRTGIRARQRQYLLRDQMEALRRSEERFQLVAEAGNDSLWDLSLVTHVLWLSDSARHLFGYPLHQRETTLDEWRSRLHPEDRERVAASFQAAVEGTGSVWTEEYRFCRADATYACILDRGHLVRDKDGRAVRAVGAMMDISDRKRSEELSSLYTAIVESSEDAMISKNLSGIILSWNSGAERLFGYTAEEAIGQSITLIIPSFLRGEEVSFLAQLREGRRIEHMETIRQTKDGRLLDISLSVSPIRDGSGKIVGASKVARNVTARKQAESKLRRQAERLRLLLEAASVLLISDEPELMMKDLFASIAPHLELDAYFNFMIDEAGTGLNLKSCIGISEEEAVQIRHLNFGQAVCGMVAQRRQPVIATHIQESDDPMVEVIKGFGIRAYACNPLMIDGKLLGTLSFASRSKDRFEPEELEFIEIVCSYVTVTYERVNLIGQLQEKDRRKDEFLATLAHELRNPLAPIRNALQIMRLAGNDSAAKEEAQQMMERQLKQMVRLIDDLLDVSRITNGKLELRKEYVDLLSIVNNAVDTSRPLIEMSQHELTVELPAEEVKIFVDPVRLAQVLSNLLNNAAKYMNHGGRIWLVVTVQGDEAVIAVRDTGIGIPAKSLQSIFDMFTQVPQSAGKAQGGLGIGLTLVKMLVEMHKGSIDVRSEGIGSGAEFTVRLPLAGAHAAPVLPLNGEEDVEEGNAAPCRVLVADDNRDAAESMSMLLHMMGAEVRTAYDGLEAVEEAAAFTPDMVLLDIGMPQLNGHEAARQIRAQARGRDMVLVALTGWGQEEDKRRSSEAGFDHHFTKPVNPADLEKLLARVRNRIAVH